VALTIRDAEPGDAAALAGLLAQLGYPARSEAIASRLERLRIVGDQLIVAVLDEAVVGLAQLHVSPTIEHERPAAKLSALVVDEARRGEGIGRALVDAALTEAKARNCAVFFLTTSERRGDAHAFYERLGLEQTGRRYGLTLSQ
jgi:GNAT superfamily N-acetyltransferase